MFELMCIFLLIIFVVFFLISYILSPPHMKLAEAHVLITGGSSGIGKAIAEIVIKAGANVTLLARNEEKLLEVKKMLEELMNNKKQKILCLPVDLASDYVSVEKAICQAESFLGPVDMLVNSAGYSVSGVFEDISPADFKMLMNVNYMGSVFATRAVIGQMKNRNRGRVVFISSQAGQMGLFGFSAYSASKFALRGLAESLQMEVSPYNIRICLAFPPDTNTPGYENEMKTKPLETKLISETSGLYQPNTVAQIIVKDALKGKFFSSVGMDGFMLSCVTSGMSPVSTLLEAVPQVVMVGLFRIIGLVYLISFDKIVKKCQVKTEHIMKDKSI